MALLLSLVFALQVFLGPQPPTVGATSAVRVDLTDDGTPIPPPTRP